MTLTPPSQPQPRTHWCKQCIPNQTPPPVPYPSNQTTATNTLVQIVHSQPNPTPRPLPLHPTTVTNTLVQTMHNLNQTPPPVPYPSNQTTATDTLVQTMHSQPSTAPQAPTHTPNSATKTLPQQNITKPTPSPSLTPPASHHSQHIATDNAFQTQPFSPPSQIKNLLNIYIYT